MMTHEQMHLFLTTIELTSTGFYQSEAATSSIILIESIRFNDNAKLTRRGVGGTT